MTLLRDPCSAQAIARRLIRKYGLDLSKLCVLTEVASGPYLYNPLIALLAGASHVMVHARDSRYGKASDVYAALRKTYRDLGVVAGCEIVETLRPDNIETADIVTNTGHLRPLDAAFIAAMKPTAVIPLMWEPWEFREGEIDLLEARRRGILVLGTNEHEAPCDMRPYSPLCALKMMLEHGIGIVDDRIAVIGDQQLLAGAIVSGLRGLGLQCRQLPVTAGGGRLERDLRWATYLIVAEHAYRGAIVGEGGVLSGARVAAAGIEAIGVIAGSVDVESLKGHGISVYPGCVEPPGHMSYQPHELGPYPVMDLFSAGLKVGESMARARLNGLSGATAVRWALERSPAMEL